MSESQERVYLTKGRPLPAALVSSPDFSELTEKQVFNFSARLRYIEEIALKIDEWASGSEKDFFAFLDALELDLSINQGAPSGDPKEYVSAWLIHTSWTFEATAVGMSRYISEGTRKQLEIEQPRLDATVYDFQVWIAGQNGCLRRALDDFFEAESFEQVLANQLIIDALLSSLLCGVTKVRLNKRVGSLRP